MGTYVLGLDMQQCHVKENPRADRIEAVGDSAFSTSLATSATPTIESLPPPSDELLRATVDKIFRGHAAELLDCGFAFAIAAPRLEGCPLIGCSEGFIALTGFDMNDVLGLNSTLLLEPLDCEAKCGRCQDFLCAAKEGRQYSLPKDEIPEWAHEDRPPNELLSVQIGARKDGILFNSLLLMRIVSLGDSDEEQPYIVALQSQLPAGEIDTAVLLRHLNHLDRSMGKVVRVFAREFLVY